MEILLSLLLHRVTFDYYAQKRGGRRNRIRILSSAGQRRIIVLRMNEKKEQRIFRIILRLERIETTRRIYMRGLFYLIFIFEPFLFTFFLYSRNLSN